MKNLQHYIDNRNQWNSFFPGNVTITFPLTQKNVDDLARSLDGDLSPENLHCDGEAPMAYVRKKTKFLDTVQRELEQYCLDNWLTTPECVYQGLTTVRLDRILLL